jgi:hypothetical protein
MKRSVLLLGIKLSKRHHHFTLSRPTCNHHQHTNTIETRIKYNARIPSGRRIIATSVV